MQTALELLKSAKRPLLHVGQGVRIAGAVQQLYEFLEVSGIPVVTARNGNDLIPSDHPQFIGRPGTFGQRGANFAVQLSDVYLAVGTRLSLAQTGYNAKDYARNAKIIHIDIDRAELYKGTTQTHFRIEADARGFLAELNRETEWPDWSSWLARCKALQAKYPAVTQEQREQKNGVNSYALVEKLSELLTPEDIIVTDMGFAFQSTHQAFRVKQGQRLFTNGGTAAMGWGLPAAIGAAVGTGRRVICIVGDGGLMFNLQELATLRHHNLNVKVFVLNNGGYLTMRQSQEALGREIGSGQKDLDFPDLMILARSFGLPCGLMLDFSYDLAGFLAHQGPSVCEVVMDCEQSQHPKSVNRRIDGKIIPTPIEDAWPYLPREEIEENLRV